MKLNSRHTRLALIRRACEGCPHRIAFDPNLSTVVQCNRVNSRNRRVSMVAGVCPIDRWDARDIYAEPSIKCDLDESTELKRLASMIGRGCGKIAIVVANGPSAVTVDLPLLKERLGPMADWFQINRPDLRVWPTDYWMFCDDPILNFRECGMPSTRSLWEAYEGQVVNSSNVVAHKQNRIVVYPPKGEPFSRDLLRCGARIGHTTVHFTMQFVLWAGYDHVYLFGVDLGRDSNGSLYPWGHNPAVRDDIRMARFEIEDASLMMSVATMTENERSRFTFCSSLLNRKFAKSFEQIGHEGAVATILERHENHPAPNPLLPPVTLLTCTGARPEALELCRQYVERQTYRGPIRWVVVDDGPEQTARTGEIVRPEPLWRLGRNTHARNMLEALKRITTPISFWIEDDDWYAPDWIEWCVQKFNENPSVELVGQSEANYYNVRYRRWHNMHNTRWATASATAFRSAAIPVIERAVNGGSGFDVRFWKETSRFFLSSDQRVVGIKGMPGRFGLSQGHKEMPNYHGDPDINQLRRWIGSDADRYAGFEAGIPPVQDGDQSPDDRDLNVAGRSGEGAGCAVGGPESELQPDDSV